MPARWSVLVPVDLPDPIAFAGKFPDFGNTKVPWFVFGMSLCLAGLLALQAHALLERLVDRPLPLCHPSAVRIGEDRTGLVDLDLS